MYTGCKFTAVYDDVWDVTRIAPRERRAEIALRGVVYYCYPGARWTGTGWIVDGDHVAEVVALDRAWSRACESGCSMRTLVQTLRAAVREYDMIEEFRAGAARAADAAAYYRDELRSWRDVRGGERMAEVIRRAAMLDDVALEDE